MALFSIFKTPSHRRFDYNPRFWDKEKEELEKRLKAAKKNVTDTELVKARISDSFRRRSGISLNTGYRQSQVRKSNIRLVLTLFVLLFIGYAVFIKFLPKIIALL